MSTADTFAPNSAVMDQTINVFHLEDYKIMRDGMRFLLTQDKDIHVVGEARTAEEMLEKLPGLKVNVLLLDFYLDAAEEGKRMDGFSVFAVLREKFPEIKIIGHSVYDDADRIARIMNDGAMGFVSKKAGYQELIKAVKTVHGGKRYISDDCRSKFKNLPQYISGEADSLKAEKDIFSVREKDVLELLAKGYSTKEIAKTLFITEKTVETHRKNMVDKAKVKNTAELMAFASTKGLLKH